MSECLFCRIAAGEIPADKVFEDEQAVVLRDINPKASVHLLVIPRQHVAGLDEAQAMDDGTLAHLLRLLPQVAEAQGLDAGYRTIINTARVRGRKCFIYTYI